MNTPVKRKRYVVEVRSHVSAEMLVFANTKDEAHEIAYRDMKESLEKQIANAPHNPLIRSMHGYTEALKTSVRQLKENEVFIFEKK